MDPDFKNRVKVGCCGFPVSQKKYYEKFDCIEINITFYQIPEISTAEKWRKSAPENFEFIIKAWQLITHPSNSPTYRRLKIKIPELKKKNYGFFQNTDEVFYAWEQTKKFALELGVKKVLFQCPSSFKPSKENIKNIKNFFREIKRPSNSFVFIWEPRGLWKIQEIKEICEEFNLIHCVDPLKENSVYGEFNYYRLHGKYIKSKIDYNYKYRGGELKKVFQKCDRKLNYVMFNNITMFDDALSFKKISDTVF